MRVAVCGAIMATLTLPVVGTAVPILGVPVATAALAGATSADVPVPAVPAPRTDAAPIERGPGRRMRAAEAAAVHGSAFIERANPQLARTTLQRLLGDTSTWVDDGGRLFVQDPPRRTNQFAAATDPTFAAPHPLANTFLLHSRPGAKRVIYLDFNGATLDTLWNGWNAGMPIRAGGLDYDGVPSTFNTFERTFIQMVWLRVAEDFAPFDIDVTTADPGLAALTRTSTADVTFGVRSVITQLNPIRSNCGCTGIAYLGVFDDVSSVEPPPALAFVSGFVFADRLDDVADTISHEVGHTVGLEHDGQISGSPYFGGQGIWGTIMGIGQQPLSQWSKGDYADANNQQDDLAVIAASAPFVADDHGNTAATATALPSAVFDEAGLVGAAGDVDVFAVPLLAGAFHVGALPAPVGANTDLRLELRSPAGVVVAAANPVAVPAGITPDAAGTAAEISADITAPGTYTLWVRGTGQGDPLVDGYSAYGSIGRYRLTSDPTTVVANRIGTGSGTITSDTGAIDCGPTCSAAVPAQSRILLTATPDPGSMFVGWTGACTTRQTTCDMFLNARTTTATAHFVDIATAPVLTVDLVHPNDPTLFVDPEVRSNEGDIGCTTLNPASCAAPFAPGTIVSLAATTFGADEGWALQGWTGACTTIPSVSLGNFAMDPACQVTMNQSQGVTASFVPGRRLTVDIREPYYGSVTYSTPNPCLATGAIVYQCRTVLATNSVVTVTARPTDQARFVGWTGACTGTALTCTVTMSAARDLGAAFEVAPRLTVTKEGTGSGSVTGGGLSCGTRCTATTIVNSAVTLTATAAKGSKFVRWNAPCDRPVGTTCTLTMNQGRSPTAIFERTTDTFRALQPPKRLLDTRLGQRGMIEEEFFEYGTPLTAGTISQYQLGSGVPAPAGSSYALNLTVITPGRAGSLKVFPCGFFIELASKPTTMTFLAGASQSTSTVVTVPAGQYLCIFSTATVHVAVDVTGWFPPGLTYAPLTTQPRLLDTRKGVRGALESTDMVLPFATGTVRRFAPLGKAGIGATGVAGLQLSITALTPTSSGSLSVYPCTSAGVAPPPTSTIQFVKGISTVTTAAVTIGASAGFCIRSTGGTHVVLSASGWYRASRGYRTFAAPGAPRRLLDTRTGLRGVLEPTDVTVGLSPGVVRRMQVAGAGGFPAATAIGSVALVVTAPGSAPSGSIKLWPCDVATAPPPPVTTTVSFNGGNASNGAMVAVSANGGVCMTATGRAVHAIIDGVGWFTR